MSHSPSRRAARASSMQRGLSIVEFMVGAAIGLFVVGGAVKVFIDLLNNNRRQLVEVRVTQDLRAAADIIARDLRRSGYWEGSLTALQPAASPASIPTNPFANATVTSVGAAQVTYAYDRDRSGTLTAASEQTGFRLNNNSIEMQIGGAWQQLTDPNAIRITSFSIDNVASSVQTFSSAQYCTCVGANTCNPATVAAGASAPQVVKRYLNISIEGQAPNDPTTTRRIVEAVRLRNDEVRGVCP